MYKEKVSFTEVNTYGNSDGDDVYTVEVFKEYCKDRLFTDYDGFGHPVKNSLVDCSIEIKPSRVGEIPNDATHIVWYNR